MLHLAYGMLTTLQPSVGKEVENMTSCAWQLHMWQLQTGGQ